MGVTDKIKETAAAVQDKVVGEKHHAATTAKVWVTEWMILTTHLLCAH